MPVSENDRDIVRQLAHRLAEVAALPIQNQNRNSWKALNRLEPVRPMVFINELPWGEVNKHDDLQCHCDDEFCRDIEYSLREKLYLWEYMPADMVIDPVFYTQTVFSDSGYGLSPVTVEGSSDYGIAARDYVPIMESDEQIDAITLPEITPDWQATEDIAVVHMWCAPWDQLIQWWGIQELYTDMKDRPEYVNRGVSKMMDVLCSRLDQLEEHNLLSLSDGNHRVGSGGLGITDQLPQDDYDGTHARPIDQWGTSTGQIFSEVSPQMHDEFCLQHELRWLERFGLNCYGCCEPLHNKLEILKQIPRLRRISMSAWVDIDQAAEQMGQEYIFSHKPNPAVFAWDTWQPEETRTMLEGALEKAEGCVVEIVMKDVSTCRNDPQRLWDWCRIAVEVAEQHAMTTA